jgi:hypothetical protein
MRTARQSRALTVKKVKAAHQRAVRALERARNCEAQGNQWGAGWHGALADKAEADARALNAALVAPHSHQVVACAPRAREYRGRGRSTRRTRAAASASGSSDPEPPPPSLTLGTFRNITKPSAAVIERLKLEVAR